jgi:hypothetical protein
MFGRGGASAQDNIQANGQRQSQVSFLIGANVPGETLRPLQVKPLDTRKNAIAMVEL